jgi:hypothetical protein
MTHHYIVSYEFRSKDSPIPYLWGSADVSHEERLTLKILRGAISESMNKPVEDFFPISITEV